MRKSPPIMATCSPQGLACNGPMILVSISVLPRVDRAGAQIARSRGKAEEKPDHAGARLSLTGPAGQKCSELLGANLLAHIAQK